MTTKNPTPSQFWPQQSPIDIIHERTFHVTLPAGYLSIDYKDAPYPGRFVGEPGHKNWELLCDRLGKRRPPTIDLGGVLAQLIKIHLHMPSEHDLEGHDQAGELHLIHRIVDPAAGSQLIVLGVFFTVADRGPCVPAEFCKAWASQQHADAQTQDEVFIDPNLLLPDPSRWYRYEGSLTTHPYDEIVSWLVFATPLGIASRDLEVLKTSAAQPERDAQAPTRRFVLRNFQ